MKKYKIFATVLSILLAISILPGNIRAEQSKAIAQDNTTTDGLHLDKTATLNNDGSYTINMEAYATGETVTQIVEKGVPLDIVLVIDQSGSLFGKNNPDRLTPLKNAVRQFTNNVYENGKKYNINHRIAMVGFASNATDGKTSEDYKKNPVAGKNTEKWVNTGIFDANGDFQNYESEYRTNERYIMYKGDMNPAGNYYVFKNNSYIPLEYVEKTNIYEEVINPATNRGDLYGFVDNTYQSAKYGNYVEKIQVENPQYGDGKTYYDKNGNELKWKQVEVPGETKYDKALSIEQNKEYYIEKNNAWIRISYKDGAWKDPSGNEYSEKGTKFVEYVFFLPRSYQAYIKQETPSSSKWILTSDGTNEITSPVYVHNDKTGWNVNGIQVNKLYELKEGQPGWQYNGENLRPTDIVYVKEQSTKLTANDYAGALVPVADGVDGQGNKRESINKAIDNFGASGATRISNGIDLGNQILQNNKLTEKDKTDGRKQVMIIFTDGGPGYNADGSKDKNKIDSHLESVSAINSANIIKNELGATLYTINLLNSGETNLERTSFMEYLSSMYPTAKYPLTPVLKSYLNKKNSYCTFVDSTLVKVEWKNQKWRYEDMRYKDQWKVVKPATSLDPESGTSLFYEYPPVFEKGNLVEGKFTFETDNVEELNNIFKIIQNEISSSTTTVNLNEKSILRDIMSTEGFEITNDSKIDVSIAKSKTVSNDIIDWDNPISVLNITKPTNEQVYEGNYQDGNTSMSIKATPYLNNSSNNPQSLDVTGFNYKEQYVAEGHPGSKLIVKITNVKALPTVTTDETISTNHDQSGIWSPKDTDGNRKLEVAFPRPTTYFKSKSYVQDYAQPMKINLKSDLRLNNVGNLDGTGYNPFTSSNVKIQQKYGDSNYETHTDTLTYSPKTMNWDGYDTFYVFGQTNDNTVKAATANANGNVWSKVNVIPANNVYYEDTFVTETGSDKVGITYTGNWKETNKKTDLTTNPENSNDNHGWIPVLDNNVADTNGSSHHVNVSDGSKAKATFAFKGTGVDIYSRTSKSTGTIIATIQNKNKTVSMSQIVDTKSISSGDGFYYQIPTLSFNQKSNGEPLPYDEYTVTIGVTTAAKDRFDYYLDGIRVYNPLGNNIDSTVEDAYGPNELNASFTEIRDHLLDAKSFSAETNTSTGAVFIDEINGKPGTTEQVLGVGSYEDLGPKNEVYLKKGQMISFNVKHQPGNSYYIGLKSPTGNNVKVSYSGNNIPNVETISHTADMYYKVTPASNGIITINNMDGDLLSITKLKVTNPNASVNASEVFAEADVNEILTAAQNFKNQAIEKPEPSKPDVDIDIPHTPNKPNLPILSPIKDLLDKIFGGIRVWF